MNRRVSVLLFILGSLGQALVACAPAPTRAPEPTIAAPTIAPTRAPAAAGDSAPGTGKASRTDFEAKSDQSGSVTVTVMPVTLQAGQAAKFDISLNTHSVDLAYDMTAITVMQDDAGKEYKPTAWEGDEPGGHHRSGTLKFPMLEGNPKYVLVLIKGMAKVPERAFRWDLR